jgi:Zn-dependent protease
VLTDLLSGNPTQAYFGLVAILVGITFHEAAHAFVADRLGDPTPRYQGRLTLNPLAHLDPIGTLLILIARFGWGKPVVFNPAALKNPILGAALISLAGPATNFLIALLFGILIRFNIQPIELWLQIAFINVLLGIFNLIPISPLDGEKVAAGLIPHEWRAAWSQIQSYGIFLLIFVIISGGPALLSIATAVLNLFIGTRGSF